MPISERLCKGQDPEHTRCVPGTGAGAPWHFGLSSVAPGVATSTSAGSCSLHGVGARGRVQRPREGPDWLPRWLDLPPRGRSPGAWAAPCLPGDSLPTAPHSQDWRVRGEGPSPQEGGRGRGQTPFQEAASIKIPSCSSACFFQAVGVRFFQHLGLPERLGCVAGQSVFHSLQAPRLPFAGGTGGGGVRLKGFGPDLENGATAFVTVLSLHASL